jgi:uncharacterized membrane protein
VIDLLLHNVAHYVALAIESAAVVIIALGAFEAIYRIFGALIWRNVSNHERRAVWLGFAHWLVAGLTFQLAADIVNTSFAPTWDEIGRLGAIAGIRTFLSFFLDREVEDNRALQRAPPAESVQR